jgi:phosphoglycolate phosphatase
MTLKAIIFDFDGTLVDSDIDYRKMKRRSIALLEASGVKRGMLSEDLLNYKIGRRSTEYLKRKGVPDEKIQILFHKIAEIMNEIELEAVETVKPVDGVEETLKELKKRKLKLGIVTRGCREYVNEILQKLSYEPLFDAVLARDDVSKPKPEPEHPLQLMKILKVKPSETILVGDHPVLDALCAQNAGIKFVLFNKQRSKHTSTIKPDYEIESFSKLLEIVDNA